MISVCFSFSTSICADRQFIPSASIIRGILAFLISSVTSFSVSGVLPSPQPMTAASERFIESRMISKAAEVTKPFPSHGTGVYVHSGIADTAERITSLLVHRSTRPTPERSADFEEMIAAPG